jgi:hypothetical protein
MNGNGAKDDENSETLETAPTKFIEAGGIKFLAKDRLVVVFDNTGVGRSSGNTPDNVAQTALMRSISFPPLR